MQYKSIWTRDIKESKIKPLHRDIETDILIIGGGITGITTAYYLKDSNLKVTLVEENRIGLGITSRTTGKINYLQETIYTDLINTYSEEIAKQYLKSQITAISKILNIIKNEHISCDLKRVTSYTFTDKEEDIPKLKKEFDFLNQNGIVIKEHNKLSIPFTSKYAISVADTYVFHPLKFVIHLKEICKKKISIYEKTKIIELERVDNGYVCYTNNHTIKAKKVILACHYPFFLKPFFIPFKTYIEKSYIAAIKVSKPKQETYITSSLPCKSKRYHKNYLLYLSNSHNLCNDLNEQENYQKIVHEVNQMGLKPSYIWSNDDLMTLDGMPYIGYIEKNNQNLAMGTGYNTWGMTNGVLAGVILSDLILNQENEFSILFDPLRTNNLHCMKSYVKIVGSSIKSYTENKIIKNKSWYSNKVIFTKKDGKLIAIYKDGRKEHMVYNTCPHMGCSLIFNEIDKTWDCSCHASRFDLDGKCIKGPSTKNITYRK